MEFPKYDKKRYNLFFHGTAVSFTDIDLSYSKGYKDFGPGFYLAESFDHARARALSQSHGGPGYVYAYLVPKQFLSGTTIRVFKGASDVWLDFVLANRRSAGLSHSFDVVLGATADADTSVEIGVYQRGLYGPVESYSAKQTLIQRLKTFVYSRQMCLCTYKDVAQVQRIAVYTV